MVRPDRTWLSLALRAGAIYDWILAAAILFGPPGLFALLRFPPPAEPFLFHLAALPPLFFPLIYWYASNDPVGRAGAVRISVMLRGGGGVLLGSLVVLDRPPGGSVYLAAAAVDLVWALVQSVAAAGGTKKYPSAQGDADG